MINRNTGTELRPTSGQLFPVQIRQLDAHGERGLNRRDGVGANAFAPDVSPHGPQLQLSRPGVCASICARMTAFLLAVRGIARLRQNRRFSLVKTFRFETKSIALKSMISQS